MLPAKSERPRRSSHGSLFIPDDGILITNVGLGKRSEAFHWLMLGHNVYDSEYRELNVRDLEREMDLHGTMNPIYVRGALWKTVLQRFWLASRLGRNGPEPAQPGLNPETSADYYGLKSEEAQQRDLPERLLSAQEPRKTRPYTRSQSFDSWSSRASRNSLSTSKSMTSLSSNLHKSSGPRLRASSTNIETTHASQSPFGLPGEARIVWTTKDLTLKGQYEIESEGFGYELVVQKRSRARLDSLFDAHSDFGEERRKPSELVSGWDELYTALRCK